MTSNLTAEEVEQALESTTDSYRYGFYWSSLAWGDADIDHLEINGEVYPFEVFDRKIGSEGDWQTDTYIVVKVGEQYFRKNGYYASHDGSYWDGSFTEVHPREKTVTVWEY